MTDHVELANYIRFRIDNVGSHNAHHRFEEMCFHLAKATITPDLVFPTGPVSSGGDRGRDFETFRGRRGDEDIAFACTVQKDGLPSKCRTDVKNAVTKGEHLDAVVFMCAGNIPVGPRHALQKEMREKYRVRLEVIDAETIADQLADHAHFGIARRFLEVPEHMAPAAPAGPDWYAASKRRWRERKEPAATFGDLIDLQESARHIVFDDGPKSDLEFWLERLRPLADPSGDYLGKCAFYQVVALTLRGTEVLVGFEAELARYFECIPELVGEVEVEDTQVLLSYVATASLMGRTPVSIQLVTAWRTAVIARIKVLLSQENNPNRFCALLLSLASAHLIATDTDDPYPQADRDAAMAAWMELVSAVGAAPYYPIGRLRQLIGVVMPVFLEHSQFDKLMDDIDELIGQRSNPDMVISWRDRGVALAKGGKPLDALSLLHRARTAWFAKETVKGSIFTGHVVAHCYGELGLLMAGKYVALWAANVAIDEFGSDVNDLISKSVFLASRFDYESGHWMGAVELTRAAILLYDELDRAPWISDDVRRDSHFIQLFGPYGVAEAFRPAAAVAIRQALIDTDTFNLITKTTSPWQGMSEEQVAEAIAEQHDAQPFCDCGETRTLRTSFGGVCWVVSCDNTFTTATAAERFLATIEILSTLAELESATPRRPATLHVELQVEGNTHSAVRIMDPARELWAVTIPKPSSAAKNVMSETISAVLTIMRSTYNAPTDEVDPLMAQLAAEGVALQLSLGGLYDTLAARIIDRDLWDQRTRHATDPLTPVAACVQGREDSPDEG
ncbi:MAG TPA: hypothetical protein PK020_04095 [Ilumatobacteraceae bacterium]|nr:hypothetical protein [Ilumatobacteraceae bacterium]